ncbi:MAG: glycosyltransferase family 4 protein [Treponema sp.]|jgi:glycosyltransferase involved in cell wall biosynthesis|nr:glycosyltransferase family 4 protein [Treponema sp.]
MNVAVDCRYLGDGSGIGVYQRETLPFFLLSPHRFTLLGNPQMIETFTAGIEANEKPAVLPFAAKPFSLGENAALFSKAVSAINACDCFYSPYFAVPRGIKVPVYTTIHDIIFPDMRELCGRAGLAARMYFYRRAARLSTTIFTVSAFSRGRLEHWLPLEGKRVVVSYNAAKSCLTQTPAKIHAKKPFIIFVGNIKKHKGLKTLLSAFDRARARGLRETLVIVGNVKNFRSRDRETIALLKKAAAPSAAGRDSPPDSGVSESAISFSGFISDERLKDLLAEASLLVQPSLYEGFGYPPLEAMTAGTAALISDIPVFREIYGGFPVTFFRAGDSDDLAEKLLLLLKDGPPAIALTPAQKKTYTFKRTAGIILDEIENSARLKTQER